MGSSISLTLWAFLGMESAAQNSDAVENPKRNVPLACMFGTLGAAVIYILSTTVIQGIVPNPELAEVDGTVRPRLRQDVQPDHRVDHHGAGGAGMPRLAARLAVHHRPDRQVGGRATHVPGLLHQGQQIRRSDHRHDRSRCGAVAPGAVDDLADAQRSSSLPLVNLAVVTNVIPYIISLSALMVMMRAAKVPEDKYRLNTAIAVIAMLYSTYAIYASGKDAVLGGMLMTAIGFIIWGFIAPRFNTATPAVPKRTGRLEPWTPALSQGDRPCNTYDRSS